MTMLVRKGLAVVTLTLASCAGVEPIGPETEGIVVLELPSASAGVTTPTPSFAGVAVKRTVDLETCIGDVRQDPFLGGPSDPSGGELYLAGLASEKRGDLGAARKFYFDMIQRFPKSPYAPLGYFAFGELFRLELGNDPSKLEFAVQSYDQALKVPPDQNPLWHLALLRKAELSSMSGDGAQVLSLLAKVMKGPPHCGDALAEAVVSMLPPAYASTARPERAAMFFASFGSDEFTAKVTTRLASLYVTQQKKADAILALHGLASSNVQGNATLCGEPLALANELGDPGVARDLSAKCDNFRRPAVIP